MSQEDLDAENTKEMLRILDGSQSWQSSLAKNGIYEQRKKGFKLKEKKD